MNTTNLFIATLTAVFSVTTLWADNIQLSATKKTADTRRSSAQQLPHGSTQLSQKSQYYRIDYRPMSPNLPASATLQYIVLQENFGGRLEEAVQGAETIELTFGQSKSVESETFELDERQWSTGRAGTGSMKQDVYGVGIRIVDEQGNILAEKYIPSSSQKELEEAFNRKAPAASRAAPEFRRDDFMRDRRPPPRRRGTNL